jgi:hypothetical protein
MWIQPEMAWRMAQTKVAEAQSRAALAPAIRAASLERDERTVPAVVADSGRGTLPSRAAVRREARPGPRPRLRPDRVGVRRGQDDGHDSDDHARDDAVDANNYDRRVVHADARHATVALATACRCDPAR